MIETKENINLKKKTARLSIMSNTFLVLSKLIIGIYVGAVSIISEAAHSAVDLLAAMIAYYAVKQSGKPPDEAHAYGHGKIENLSGAIEAILIIIAAVYIIFESVEKLKVLQEPEYLEMGILVMLFSIIINYFVSRRLFKVARQTHSQALEADALHLQADIWTSVGVLLGLLAMKVTGWIWLDPIIAIVVAIIIFKTGYTMTMKSAMELTDVCLPLEDEETIIKILKTNDQVVDFHKLRTRRSGSYRLIDVHLVLDKNMPLQKAHEICDEIETDLKDILGRCDIVIHAEPCGHEEEKLPKET